MFLKSERGSTIMLTVVVLVILLFLAGALGLYSIVESRFALREEQDLQAYYLARSGADAVAEKLQKSPGQLLKILGLSEDSEGAYSAKSDKVYDLGHGYFQVEVIKDADRDVDDADGKRKVRTITIVSKGVVGEREKGVKLTLTASKTDVPEVKNAIFAGYEGTEDDPAIDLRLGLTVNAGPVGTNSTEKNSVKMDGAVFIPDGEFLVGPGGDPGNVIKMDGSGSYNEGVLEEKLTYPPPKVPDYPTLTKKDNLSTLPGQTVKVDADGHYEEISIAQGSKLEVDLADGEVRRLRIDTLRLNGSINLANWGDNDTVDGRLILYVDNLILGGAPSLNAQFNKAGNDSERLTLYHRDQREDEGEEHAPFKISNSLSMLGNIIVEKAPINFGLAGTMRGGVYSAGTEVNFGATTSIGDALLLYAPKADVNVPYGTLSWQKGAFVCSRMLAEGSVNITYDTNLGDIPSWIIDGSDGGGEWGYERGLWSKAEE